ncbi:NAD-dependent protein deacylase [Paenibacillus chartarius]|uniref:NAD-dependent protein deacetylase n=1 Tax=Paenibacillus chartarius TaxID=747481 RepID=A0ABV6DFN8_9BACL
MELAALKEIIANSRHIVFFGGAGVSTESGIPDFRSAAGLYQKRTKSPYPPEVMLSHSFFMEHTEQFFEFYLEQMIYKDARPNQAHIALAQLELAGRLRAVVTQNIDGLHQQAGSRNVLELHGSVYRNTCMTCSASYNLEYVLLHAVPVPKCSRCGGTVKPDVVLYEESLDMELLNRARDMIAAADVLIVGGTSLTVNPAAGLVRQYNGDKLVIINKTPTPFDSRANYLIHGSIGKVLNSIL